MSICRHGIGWRVDFTKNCYRHKSAVFDTEREARNWETIRRGEIAAGTWQPDGAVSQEQPTVAQVLKWYGTTFTPQLVREPHREISRIKTICKNKIAGVRLDELDNKILTGLHAQAARNCAHSQR